MKILFAPSESKFMGGNLPPIDSNAFIFPGSFIKRLEIIEAYQNQIKQNSDLATLFGINNPKEIERYCIDIMSAPTVHAIERYTGVAFEYLDIHTLEEDAKNYLKKNLILFSNLFGPIGAYDRLPEYKVKQGSVIGEFATEKHYKKCFSSLLDEHIGDEEILDLRAGFYDKFYIPKKSVVTVKFLKSGKVVSHWAKAYRGIVLRELAKKGVSSIEEFKKMTIEGINLDKTVESRNKIELIYRVE